MNNYQKMTLESFLEKLKDKQYVHATAARRGIGKAQHLSAKDKASAHEAIDHLFCVTTAFPAGTKTFAKQAAPKKAAKKVAKKAAVKAAPKKAAAAKVAAKAAPKKAAKKHVARSTSVIASALLSTTSLLHSSQTNEASVMRQHAASTVLGSLLGRSPLTKQEELLYQQATHEYLTNGSPNEATNEAPDQATPAIKASERIGHPRIPVQATKAAPTNGNGVETDIDPEKFTPEQKRQTEIIAASKAIHGGS